MKKTTGNVDQAPYSSSDRHFFEVEHAIDIKIAAARPYEGWGIKSSNQNKLGTELTAGSRALLKARYRGLSTAPTIIGWGNQTPGWIINRHPVPGAGQIFPEIRGDAAIATDSPTRHYHGARDWREIEELQSWPEWRRRKYVRTPEWAERSGHIRRAKYEDDHGRGASAELVHDHRNLAKYTFPPSPKEWKEGVERHEHGQYARAGARAKHVEAKHSGIESAGVHEKYRYRYRVPTLPVAKRIDVHPQALFRFRDARIVYFALEGCLKSDAILTHILKRRLSSSVFSVPSVTLWDAAELPGFVERYLLATQPAVIIVTDSDWNEIPAVATQARLCRSALLRMGLETVRVAAPPPGTKGKKQGIDDFLATGAALEDMEVIHRMPATLLWPLVQGAVSKRAFNRAFLALNGLSMHADAHGRYQSSIEKLLRVTNWPRNGVYRGKADLEEAGLIEIEGTFAFRKSRFHRDEWDDEAPTVIIREDLRASDEFRQRLGDIPWATDTYGRNVVRGRLAGISKETQEAVLA